MERTTCPAGSVRWACCSTTSGRRSSARCNADATAGRQLAVSATSPGGAHSPGLPRVLPTRTLPHARAPAVSAADAVAGGAACAVSPTVASYVRGQLLRSTRTTSRSSNDAQPVVGATDGLDGRSTGCSRSTMASSSPPSTDATSTRWPPSSHAAARHLIASHHPTTPHPHITLLIATLPHRLAPPRRPASCQLHPRGEGVHGRLVGFI